MLTMRHCKHVSIKEGRDKKAVIATKSTIRQSARRAVATEVQRLWKVEFTMTNYKGNDKNAQKGNKTSNTNTSKGGNNIMMNDKNVVKVNGDGTVTLTVDALRELLLGTPKAPAVSKAKAAKKAATKAEPKKTGADALKAYRDGNKDKPYTEVKFGTQEYLRVPRKDGTHKEVAHINFCTKKNRCVGSLDLAKYEKSDFTYVKEFFVANCDKFTYDTDKLNKVGVTSPTDVRRMSEYTMKAAFGC